MSLAGISKLLDSRSLRFRDAGLEREYADRLRPRFRRQLRTSLVLSMFTWPMVGVAGYFVVDSARTVVPLVIGMWGFLLMLLLLERRAPTTERLHLIGAVSNCVPGLAGLAALWVEGAFDTVGPIALLSVAVFSFTLLGIPFLWSLVAILPYVVVCLVMMVLSEAMPLVPLQAALILLTTGVLAVGTYMRESAARRDYFLTRRVAEQEKELEAAKELGAYTLESKLGQGGMGVVYRASHRLLRRPTAVKLLSTNDATAEDLARFEREVQLTAELSHPNIISVYDYGHSPAGEFYYAMEHLDGLDLESLVREHGPIPVERAVPILMQVCEALDEAHAHGLVHRDIKPGNIMISRIGRRADVVKVLDFGLVKVLDAELDSREGKEVGIDAGLIVGTPAYIAPEAITNPDAVGPGADLYAVGAVAFYLLTGERVFGGSTLFEVLSQHVHGTPRPPSLLSKLQIPPALDDLILRSLAKSPDQRFETGADMRAALAAIEVGPYDGANDWWDRLRGEPSLPPVSPADDRPLISPLALTVDLGRR